RDFHVTGVQTCALPIWNLEPGGLPVKHHYPTSLLCHLVVQKPGSIHSHSEWLADVHIQNDKKQKRQKNTRRKNKRADAGIAESRSEERRVGKEGRSRQ